MVNKLLAVGMLIPMLMLIAPNVYARHLSDAQRYSDGFANGGQAAATDRQQGIPFNTVCDPTGNYTSGGGHTTTYCTGWVNGYTATWNNAVQAQPATKPQANTTTNHASIPSPQQSVQPVVSPSQQPIPSDSSWTGGILFVLVVIIIAAIAWKIKHSKGKHRERQDFSESTQEKVLEKQHHRCGHCKRLLNVVDYDHKNGDRSDNKESNCVALCPNCHAIKTRSTR